MVWRRIEWLEIVLGRFKEIGYFDRGGGVVILVLKYSINLIVQIVSIGILLL